MPDKKKITTGVIIGKFNPPHQGHQYLIQFAEEMVDQLTVLVCTLPHEKIPGELRFQWMQELFPTVQMVHITEINPAANRHQPDAWKIWTEAVTQHIPMGVDYVFASEDYGWKLAEGLDARFVPLDPQRDRFPISATNLRDHTLKFWNFLPESIRYYFVKQISIFGSGAQKLSEHMAKKFNTLCIHDYRKVYNRLSEPYQSSSALLNEESLQQVERSYLHTMASHANRLLFQSSEDKESAIEILKNKQFHLCISIGRDYAVADYCKSNDIPYVSVENQIELQTENYIYHYFPDLKP